MVKFLLSDYCHNRKEAFLQAVNNGGYYVFINMTIIMMLFQPITHHIAGRNLIVWYTEMIFLLLTLLISRMYPNSLPKIMYLCPMCREERKQYLWTGFYLRILVVNLLFLLLNGGLLLTSIGNKKDIVLLLVIFLSFSLTSNTCFKPVSRSGTRSQTTWQKDKFYWYSGWMIFALALSCINFLILVYSMINPEPWVLWETIMILFMIGMQILASVIILARYLRPGMEMVLDYEAAYPANGKEKVD